MAKKVNRDWIHAIASRAHVEPDKAEAILDSKGIRPSPVVASPRRLAVRRIAFSGVKKGEPKPGPFEFEWDAIGEGLWAMVTERNFRGKSSVIEFVRWMLRGRPSSRLQQDVRGWLHQCSLRFSLDETLYEVLAATLGAPTGRLVRFGKDNSQTELAAFNGDAEFEAVMSGFFMREFGLDIVTRWRGDAEEDGGRAVVHGWPSLSGAMFIGTNYSVLLGDMPPDSGLTVPLMQMYLGLPWVSTLTAAKAAEQGARRAHEARERRRKAGEAGRNARRDALRAQLEATRQKRDATPSDADVRAELARLQSELSKERKVQLEAQARLDRERSAMVAAEVAHVADRHELQAHLDAEAAGAAFRMLDPSFCPRCDAAVTDERREREKEMHACSVCGAHIGHPHEDAATARKEFETRVKASKAAHDKARKSHQDACSAFEELQARIGVLESKIDDLSGRLATFGIRQRLDVEVSVLEARLQEASFDPEPEAADIGDAVVLKAAVEETEKRVKSVQEDLLKAVSSQIVRYARRFGMVNITEATLKGNTHLRLVKGEKETGYGDCTEGEKLRLKVAAVLAMIRVAEEGGVGRHPGLLMIDSPGAQEVAREDLDELISGLQEASKEFEHLQVFIAAMSSPAVLKHVPTDRMRYAKGGDPLW
ncbi:large ATP-binding protein [Sorangium sp. So ce233]|uniref:large ATP-binding protein n=1 Tax=Sorangium sp. So ce233 TaxID=3133290 RepID=UPI003F640AD4